MSIPYPRKPDPLSLAAIDESVMDGAMEAARSSERRRAMIHFHRSPDEPVQRMVNAIEPESYVRPHRHTNPARPEIFVVLRGSVLIVRFSDDGAPIEGLMVSADGPVRGAEIQGEAWHTVVALSGGTVLYEVTQGPYNAATNEEFAPWAPPAEDAGAAQVYIAALRAQFEPEFRELAARNQIEAEEDEIC